MITAAPFFTIGIPTRNRTGILTEALASVFEQSFSDWEIVIVNDGGVMPISPRLENMLTDPRIRLFDQDVVLGRGAARQRIVTLARGTWMLWLDDDDIFSDKALQNIAGALQTFTGSITAFQTTGFHVRTHSWRKMAQVGFDASMFADNARNLVEARLSGSDMSNHFGYLWSKVARTDFYRKIGFQTDPEDVRSQTLEDVDFVIRALKDQESIAEIPLAEPAYIFRMSGPNTRVERPEEPDLRLRSCQKIFDCYAAFYEAHSADASYEYACMEYLLGGAIHNQLQRPHDALRLRAQTAVSAGGPLMELFLAEIMRQVPATAGAKFLKDPATPIELKRMSQPFIPLKREEIHQNLIAKTTNGAGSAPRSIRTRFRAGKAAIASHMQFVEGIALPDLPPDSWSVYGIDWRRQQWVLVDVPYKILRNIGIFAYEDQFNIAGAVRRVGFGALAALSGTLHPSTPHPSTPLRPVLPFFSIGRCGSTVFGRLLAAADCDVLYELDAFTQISRTAQLFPNDVAARGRLEQLTLELTAHLARQTPDTGKLVLKMRSQASEAAAFFLTEPNTKEVLFLVRGLEAWYRSSSRAFPERSKKLAGELVANFKSINAALERGVKIRVLTYERLVADPVAEVGTLLGSSPDVEAINSVMAKDAQAGTSMARDKLKDVSPDMAGYEAFVAEWRANIDPVFLKRLGLDIELQPLAAGPESYVVLKNAKAAKRSHRNLRDVLRWFSRQRPLAK